MNLIKIRNIFLDWYHNHFKKSHFYLLKIIAKEYLDYMKIEYTTIVSIHTIFFDAKIFILQQNKELKTIRITDNDIAFALMNYYGFYSGYKTKLEVKKYIKEQEKNKNENK